MAAARRCFPNGLLALLLAPQPAPAAEITGYVTTAMQLSQERSDSPYRIVLPEQSREQRSQREDLYLRLDEGTATAQLTLRRQTAEDGRTSYPVVTHQLYVDGGRGDGVAWTIGKKVLSWGVGYGFRPLDVIQREDRRGINPPPLVGVPLLALEHFSGTDAWTLVWSHPGQGRGDKDFQDSSWALRGYRLTEQGDDLHAVLRYSHRRQWEIGLGLTRVIGEEWSLHAAGLWSQRYHKILNTLAERGELWSSTDPMTPQTRHGGYKAVIGAQWSGASGLSLLAEAWLDDDAYRADEWQRLHTLTAHQLSSPALPAAALAGQLAWSSQAYLAPNLMRENLLLRLAFDDGNGFKPYLEYLATPRDGGHATSLGATLEQNRHRLRLGWRTLGGPATAALAQAPSKSFFWLEWRWAL